MEGYEGKMESTDPTIDENLKRKSSIIPEDWKGNVDKIWNEDLVNANRYFSSINPEISELINNESRKVPDRYLDDLVFRWDWHNIFFEDFLEPAIPELLPESSFELTPRDIDTIESVYETMSTVDQATLVTSAGIKKHVDYWIQIYKERGEISENEARVILTPPNEPFQASYTIDHLRYILADKHDQKSASELKGDLIKKYHIGDEKIFLGRLEKLNHYKQLSDDRIEEIISELAVGDSYKTNHFYLTIERPKLKALSEIVAYDNINEHRISNQLIGISGLILRKKVLDYLNHTKILPNEGGIYSHTDEEIVNGLEKLKEYRKEYMEKMVTHYRQTGDTCGAACLMMALHHFGQSDISKETEEAIFEKSSTKHTTGTHFSGLALQATEKKLETLLIHSENEMFKNDGQFDSIAFDKLMEEYKSFAEQGKLMGLRVENGGDWSAGRIRNMIENGYLIISAGKIGSILHAVLITGYNKELFIVHDPMNSKASYMSSRQLEDFMDTKIGKWGIAIRSNDVKTKTLVEALPRFKIKGEELLREASIDN